MHLHSRARNVCTIFLPTADGEAETVNLVVSIQVLAEHNFIIPIIPVQNLLYCMQLVDVAKQILSHCRLHGRDTYLAYRMSSYPDRWCSDNAGGHYPCLRGLHSHIKQGRGFREKVRVMWG